MELQLFGINHKTSNVAEREKFIINESNQILLDSHLKKLFGNDFESFFGISTCNRTEIYLVGRPGISKHIFKESHKSLKIGITSNKFKVRYQKKPRTNAKNTPTPAASVGVNIPV